jgi:hypothetical protein
LVSFLPRTWKHLKALRGVDSRVFLLAEEIIVCWSGLMAANFKISPLFHFIRFFTFPVEYSSSPGSPNLPRTSKCLGLFFEWKSLTICLSFVVSSHFVLFLFHHETNRKLLLATVIAQLIEIVG